MTTLVTRRALPLVAQIHRSLDENAAGRAAIRLKDGALTKRVRKLLKIERFMALC